MTPEILSDMESNDLQNAPGSKAPAPSPMPSIADSAGTHGDLAGDGDLPRQAAGASQQELKDDRDQIRGLLNEARNTKAVLAEFDSAIRSGTFQGSQMMAVAKGLSFLAAILSQNKAHIDNLQLRLEKCK